MWDSTIQEMISSEWRIKCWKSKLFVNDLLQDSGHLSEFCDFCMFFIELWVNHLTTYVAKDSSLWNKNTNTCYAGLLMFSLKPKLGKRCKNTLKNLEHWADIW